MFDVLHVLSSLTCSGTAGCGVCQAAGNGLAGVRVWRAGCLWWLRGLGRVGVVGGFIVVFLRGWVNVY